MKAHDQSARIGVLLSIIFTTFLIVCVAFRLDSIEGKIDQVREDFAPCEICNDHYVYYFQSRPYPCPLCVRELDGK